MMYGIDHDIFNRPMDGVDMEVDQLTLEEILNFSETKNDEQLILNLNDHIENGGNFENLKEEKSYFELNVDKEESGEAKVFNYGMNGNNYVGNGFVNNGVKRENMIGMQRIGMRPMMNGFGPKVEFPNSNGYLKPQNNFMMNMPSPNIQSTNLLIPDYSVKPNTAPELDEEELNENTGLNVESNENELNTKKRKSMNLSKVDFDDYKLPPSKTPIIDAIIYCAIKGEGITIESRDQNKILFKVTDYEVFYEKQKQVCSKQNPTDDESSRIKTIQRWFKNFPTKKERSKTNQTIFYFSVEKSISEDKFRKIGKIIEKLEASINVNKRRRTK